MKFVAISHISNSAVLKKEILCNSRIELVSQYENFFICSSSNHVDLTFAQVIWWSVQNLQVKSITDAATQLKKISNQWIACPYTLHRRTELIQQKLKKPKHTKDLKFLQDLTTAPWGEWCLVNPNELMYSTEISHPIPSGIAEFIENKSAPSRAYLKLWELMTIYKVVPEKNSVAIDLGSSPGGWTWVLQSIGCKVISVDKAPLDKKILALDNIEYLKQDAFKVNPEELPKIDWLFSDIICTPPKLMQLIQKWLPFVNNMVCTVKFVGNTDFETLAELKKIPNSKVIHLYNNKHEATWIYQNK